MSFQFALAERHFTFGLRLLDVSHQIYVR